MIPVIKKYFCLNITPGEDSKTSITRTDEMMRHILKAVKFRKNGILLIHIYLFWPIYGKGVSNTNNSNSTFGLVTKHRTSRNQKTIKNPKSHPNSLKYNRINTRICQDHFSKDYSKTFNSVVTCYHGMLSDFILLQISNMVKAPVS